MIRKTGGMGIAIENNCALVFIDGRFYKLIKSKEYARAYRLFKTGGQIVTEQIPEEKQLASVAALYRQRRKSVR
jgi:hypothetical protein